MDETNSIDNIDSTKILEDIGADEIAKRTHIEVRYIKFIINSEFDKLNRVNALGFVRIISREFGVDLSSLTEEMQRYWDTHVVEEPETKIFIAQKPKVFPKILIWIVYSIILVAILFGAYYFVDKKLDFFQSYLSKSDANYTYDETPVVKEATKTLIEDKNSTLEVVSEENLSLNDEISMQEDNTSENIIDDTEEENSSLFENSDTKTVEEVTDNPDKNLTLDKNSSKSNVAVIVPNVKLWVGIIYLDDDSRDSYLGDGNLSIDLSREQLITTGHGNFSIVYKDRVEKLKSQTPKKFLVKDGKMEEISIEKFKELNKGNLW